MYGELPGGYGHPVRGAGTRPETKKRRATVTVMARPESLSATARKAAVIVFCGITPPAQVAGLLHGPLAAAGTSISLEL